eukprot:TRINITY_DN3617_c0_g1_i1.p1 TRINITY_DN3617_c0_g1~~TRINITY_DN3617_c0_g1_i1.p1  ORF type:complete len:509 (-),score=102.21 TRINITY_DN3617_c0_g1_i1:178-1548(-)
MAKHGLCGHLVLLMDTLAMASDIDDRAAKYLQVVVSLLLFFAKEGDAVVKAYMVKGQVLEGLMGSLEFLDADLQAQVCKTFMHLAQEPSVLNMMENAGVVPVLVHQMLQHDEADASRMVSSSTDDAALPEASGLQPQDAQDACSQCLLALSYLCKLSRPRQEQAALAGIVPKLQALTEQPGYPLKEHAFVMLCDMTCASLATRRYLWSQGGADFLVRSLAIPEFQVAAFEALVGWFGVREHRADWCERLEKLLLRSPDFMERILVSFRCQDGFLFQKFLDPLLKLVRVSKQINSSLASSYEFITQLLNRLQLGDAASLGAREPRMSLALMTRFKSDDCLSEADWVARSASVMTGKMKDAPNGVRRLVSAQPVLAADDTARARQGLLRLLLLLCQGQSTEQLVVLCVKYRLKAVVHHVLLEERRRQRVILCEIASQLLEILQKASPEDISTARISEF